MTEDPSGTIARCPFCQITPETKCNTWIMKKYCNHWGLWEAIREILQNQWDGMTEIAKLKSNIDIKRDPDGLKYEFKNKLNGELIGGITYDSTSLSFPILTVWNKGRLYTSFTWRLKRR